MWRGERGSPEVPPRVAERLGPLAAALAAAGALAEHAPFAEDDLPALRQQLLALDAVLVFVNPVQDGVTRARLDGLLRQVAATGVLVSAHPDVALRLGSKGVLVSNRDLDLGTDCERYAGEDELSARLPRRLAEHGRLVLKQARGNGGDGVWSVELATPGPAVGRHSKVWVLDAASPGRPAVEMALGAFLETVGRCFAWSGSIVDQPYQERLADGMIRCYFSQDELVGFCHQFPTGLLAPAAAAAVAAAHPAHRPPEMEPPGAPRYERLRRQLAAWLVQLRLRLGLDRTQLPLIWDADLLYGRKDEDGHDSYVLCEVNASCVWPFPPDAAPVIAANSLALVGGTPGGGTRGGGSTPPLLPR